MSVYDTAALIANARRVSYAPTATAPGSADSDLVNLMNFEMHSSIVPKLRGVNEEHFVVSTDLTIVSGTSSYAIPTRAVAGSIRDVMVVRSDGSLQPLPRLELSELPSIFGINPTQSGMPVGFYPLGNNLLLFPAPGSSIGSLRVYYEMRPNDLVLTSAVGLISAINTGTGVVTCNIPAAFTTSQTYDFVKGTPHFDSWSTGKSTTAVGASTITFAAADLPANLAVGDYVCLATQSAVPQIPYELHFLLTQRLIVKLHEMNGQTDRIATAQSKLNEMEEAAFTVLAPRLRGKTKTIVQRNWF